MIEQEEEKRIKAYFKQKQKIRQNAKLSWMELIEVKLSKSMLKYSLKLNIYSFVVLCMLSGILLFLLSSKLFGDMLINLIFGIGGLFIPYFILDWIIYFQNNKIRKQIMNFLAILINNLKITNGDIYMAIQRSIDKMEDPLKTYLWEFDIEYRSGVNIVKCFEKLKEKVSDYKFSRIADVLYVHMIKGGKPEVSLNSLQKEFLTQEIEEDRRRKQQLANVIGVCIAIFANIIIVALMNKVMPEFFEEIRTGNYRDHIVVAIINICISIFLATKAVRTKLYKHLPRKSV